MLFRSHDDYRTGVYAVWELDCKHGAQYRNGKLFGVYDTAAGDKIYCKTCHDDEGNDGGSQRQKAADTVGGLRDDGRIYLWVYRRRRRNDDAAGLDKRLGI